MTRPALAFLGLGLMGAPMARRLCAAGYQVHVWNRSPEKLADALAAGAVAAPTPRAAAEAAQIVLMCLMDARAVEAVVFGADGVAAARGGAHVLVDHSSMRPDRTREFAARLEAANGMQWVDAPVSGGVKGAGEGSLAIMCGGAPAAFAAVRAVLSAYGANINLMGPSGAGQVTKLCNQVIAGTNMAVLAEAVRLAQNAGVDAAMLPRALAGGWADSKPLQILVPRMVAGYDKPVGASDTMLKDLDTALDLGRETCTPLPVAGLAAQLLRILSAQGKGEEEPSVLVDLYREPRR
ncbi:MAG: NAD(P)-dependent oxidoreductase [Burkholderiales bacterium]|nr:NAD(P)-dependent oxidoreductase [Burkholderiales bacterium]